MERVETIIEHFTFLLYTNVCRSLFERHKLLFAFLLCARILLDRGVIRQQEFDFLLNGAKIEQVNRLPYLLLMPCSRGYERRLRL
jgi:dynein heavy chain, axonemal